MHFRIVLKQPFVVLSIKITIILSLFKSTKVGVPYFNTNISGINSYKKVLIQAASYFAIFSLGVFAKLRPQGGAHMKLVETKQDVPEKYLYCHKRDTQGINCQYPKINIKWVLFYMKQFITRTSQSLFQNMSRGIFQGQ